MTSKSQHNPDTGERPPNQNDQMSDDPGGRSRRSAVLGREGARKAAERSPAEHRQDQSTIEAFGEEGAGVAAKE
jgi:hypothetical protein